MVPGSIAKTKARGDTLAWTPDAHSRFPKTLGGRKLTAMRAILHDCEGPLRTRAAPLALLGIPLLLALFDAPGALTFALTLLFACVPGVMPRFAPREVEVALGGGALRFRGAGLLTQTLHARDLVGACTARVHGGIALTLARRDRQTPTTLVFASETDLEHAREALAVGHGGFGAVTWPLAPGAAHTWAPAARGIAAFLAFFAAVAVIADSTAIAGTLLFFGCILALFGILWAAARSPKQTLELGPRGVSLRGFQHSEVPYSVISGVALSSGRFELGVQGGSLRAHHNVGPLAGAGVDTHELELLSAQLAACVARAGGLGPPKAEAATRVDTLRRGHESARDWLARVDMAASMLLQPGYRGGAIEREDLWLTLKDPEADFDLRAAAGRVLVRVESDPAVRTRVGDIVAAVREESSQRRLRVAIFPELDPEGQELEQLDRAEAKQSVMR